MYSFFFFSAVSHRPKTSYYQYSLGILALCVSGIRVNAHVSHKLIHAVEHGQIKHGESLCVGKFKIFFLLLICSDVRNQDNKITL